jgi:hypothetical protein
MSQMGQSRRLRRAQCASAIPPIATGSLHCGDRRFGPISAARTRSKGTERTTAKAVADLPVGA